MKTGLDSAYPPSPAQIAAAQAAGYSAWLGYFAGPDILNGWADSDFQNVLDGGLATAAYCSGWADPAQMKARADALGIVGMLDDESGIRSVTSANRQTARAMMHGGAARPVMESVNGVWRVSSWVQPWLDTSGFGQYGNLQVFAGIHATRYVFAAYLGYDPGASWPSYYPRPTDGNPCGWQFQGTTSMFGRGVDLTHFDDGFFAFGGGGGSIVEDEMKDFLIRNTTNATVYWVRGYTLTPVTALADLAPLSLPLIEVPDADFDAFEANMAAALKAGSGGAAFPTKAETVFS